jgi:outer membrane lipoprotein-sorting protein
MKDFQHLHLKFVKGLISITLVVFIATSCAHRQEDLSLPKTSILIKDQSKVLNEVKKYSPNLTSLQGDAKVKMYRKRSTIVGKQEIAIKAPGSLYVETVNPFGSLVSLLVSENSSLQFYDSSNNRLYRGKPFARDLSQLFPI